jgi:hypothetical protein
MTGRRSFPGWPWVATAVALPVSGYVAWKTSGPVDSAAAAIAGGAITGAALGTVQWWAAKGALGRARYWIAASAGGYAVGLAGGAALVGYDTDLGSLALMGLVSGASLGAAQGLTLARRGDRRLAVAWGAAMPILFALAWSATSAAGVSVEEQFTVFGAAGAFPFMLLTGLLLARFTSDRLSLRRWA